MLSSCCGPTVSVTELANGCVLILVSGQDPVQICPGSNVSFAEDENNYYITIDGETHPMRKDINVQSFALIENTLVLTETDGTVHSVVLPEPPEDIHVQSFARVGDNLILTETNGNVFSVVLPADQQDIHIQSFVRNGNNLVITETDGTTHLVTLAAGVQTQVIRGTTPNRNVYTVDHKGTWANEQIRMPRINITGDLVQVDIFDHTVDQWKTFGVLGGESFFNNPIFYVTDGAPAPNTALFTVAGNTVGNSFPSMAAAMAFIASAYIFGTITFDIQGRVHNLNINPTSVKGASFVRIRPRNLDANNLIFEYAKSNQSRGIMAANNINLTILTGFVTESFGVGDSIGSINAAVLSNSGANLVIQLDAQNPNSFIRHTGIQPLATGALSSIWYSDEALLNITTNNIGGDQNLARPEIFDMEPPASTDHYYNCYIRLGANSKFDTNGLDRIYLRDVHVFYDMNAPNILNSKQVRYSGAVSSISPFMKISGPGHMVICGNAAVNFGFNISINYRASTDDDAVGTSETTYKSTMRYRYRDGADSAMYSDIDKLSIIQFSKAPNVTDPSTAGYAFYYGTRGANLPAGV